MVCFCPIRRILYVHIPKTGGLTIENILVEKYDFKYFTFEKNRYEFLWKNKGSIGIYKYILTYSDEAKEYDLDNFFKFTFVRNPHKRAVSGVRFLHKNAISNLKDFPDNLADFYLKSTDDIFYSMHFNMTQCSQIRNLNNEINFDFVGRHENFSNDLENVLFDILKLEIKDINDVHINKSVENYLTFNVEDVYEMSDILHEEDFKYFGY